MFLRLTGSDFMLFEVFFEDPTSSITHVKTGDGAVRGKNNVISAVGRLLGVVFLRLTGMFCGR